MVTEDDNSDILNLEFVAKCEGRYSVSVNMYGVGVKGSPMVVDILCSEMRLYRNSKRWLYKLYKQKNYQRISCIQFKTTAHRSCTC